MGLGCQTKKSFFINLDKVCKPALSIYPRVIEVLRVASKPKISAIHRCLQMCRESGQVINRLIARECVDLETLPKSCFPCLQQNV